MGIVLNAVRGRRIAVVDIVVVVGARFVIRRRYGWEVEDGVIVVGAVGGEAFCFHFRLDGWCRLDVAGGFGALWHCLESSACVNKKLIKIFVDCVSKIFTFGLEWHDADGVLGTAVRIHRHRGIQRAFILMQWIDWLRLSRHIAHCVEVLIFRI